MKNCASFVVGLALLVLSAMNLQGQSIFANLTGVVSDQYVGYRARRHRETNQRAIGLDTRHSYER
jgi:hypothetical protein